LLNQHRQVLAEAVAAVILAVGVEWEVLLVAARALRQRSTVAAFAEHQFSGERTLPEQA
jgi:hypothetical protein